MRDIIKDKSYFESYINKKNNQIVMCEESIKNAINSRVEVRLRRKKVIYTYELICSEYSYGMDLDYINTQIDILINLWIESFSPNTYNLNLNIVSLMRLFDKDFTDVESIFNDNKIDDWLLDFIINPNADLFEKKLLWKEFKILKDSVYNADKDLLIQYINKGWYNQDCGCWNFHNSKEDIYYGYWCFFAGAISKIMGFDDSEMLSQKYYPYDMVHYNFRAPYVVLPIDSNDEVINKYDKEIYQNNTIQNIIPNKLYMLINDILKSYDEIDSKEFWEKYNLNEVWYSLEDFEEDKDTSLGEIIVNILVDHEYILQLDYKEVDAEDADFNDIISWIPELWDCDNYKVIRFELDNDQYYFAKIPAENEICDLYEVKVSEVKL